MATHTRDWPLPHSMWEIFVFLALSALLSIVARESYGAAPAPSARPSWTRR